MLTTVYLEKFNDLAIKNAIIMISVIWYHLIIKCYASNISKHYEYCYISFWFQIPIVHIHMQIYLMLYLQLTHGSSFAGNTPLKRQFLSCYSRIMFVIELRHIYKQTSYHAVREDGQRWTKVMFGKRCVCLETMIVLICKKVFLQDEN